MKPFKYGLEVVKVYDGGSLFDTAVLDITDDNLVASVGAALANVAALSFAANYPTIACVPHLVIDGYKNVLAIALETDYSFPLADKVGCCWREGGPHGKCCWVVLLLLHGPSFVCLRQTQQKQGPLWLEVWISNFARSPQHNPCPPSSLLPTSFGGFLLTVIVVAAAAAACAAAGQGDPEEPWSLCCCSSSRCWWCRPCCCCRP